jgi:hypothetical protein
MLIQIIHENLSHSLAFALKDPFQPGVGRTGLSGPQYQAHGAIQVVTRPAQRGGKYIGSATATTIGGRGVCGSRPHHDAILNLQFT